MAKILSFPGAEPLVVIDPAFEPPFDPAAVLGFTVRVERARADMLHLKPTWHPTFGDAENLAQLICLMHGAVLENRTFTPEDEAELMAARRLGQSRVPPPDDAA